MFNLKTNRPMDNMSLDVLFSAAKSTAPEITFEETQTAFLGGLAAAGSASIWMKIVNTFKNPFIMISTTGIIIATLTLTVFNSSEHETKAQNVSQMQQPKVTEAESSVITPQKEIAVYEIENQDDQTFTQTTPLEQNLEEVAEIKTVEALKKNAAGLVGRKGATEAIGYNPSIEKENVLEYVYNISHATSENEFLAMQLQAEKAGIDFTFKMKKDKLRKLKMEVKDGSNAQYTSLLFSGEFESTIGWVTNEDGSFVSFYESEEAMFYEALDDALGELKDIYEDLRVQLDDIILDEEKLANAYTDLNVLRGAAISKIMDIDPYTLENPIDYLENVIADSDSLTAKQVAAIETDFELQEDEGLEKVIIDISESTTEEELIAIQEKAIKAGITMSMDYKYKKDVLTKLDIGMRVKSNGKNKFSSFQIKSSKRGLWNSQLVWRVNENGEAVDFDNNRCQMISIK